MRYLILSDIHANRQALEAVLKHARGRYDTVACCGDVVGYGADPEFAVDWVRSSTNHVVRGNHDRACAGLDDLEWFNPAARKSALWTLNRLDGDRAGWLRSLPQGPLDLDGFHLIHGSPIDEDDYVLGLRDAAEVSPYLERALTFFGHTHMQGGFLIHRNGVLRVSHPSLDDPETTLELEPDAAYLVNPGSIGQPRDGDPRAAYAIYSSEERIVSMYRVEYDIDEAARRIRAAGLPDLLAERLSSGR